MDMTRQKGINVANGSSVGDHASTDARGKRDKNPPSGARGERKGYPPEIEALTQKIKKIQSQELEARVEIGLELLKAKDLLAHGEFRPWVRREFRWSERTATNYMELAKHYEGKTAKFADLDLGTALALVTDTTLEKVRNEVFERAETDEKIIREDVQKQIAEVKATQPKRLAKAKKEAPSAVSEAFLAAGKSPAQEVAEALLNLLSIVEKNKPHCEPDDIAVFFVNDDHKRISLATSGSFGFVSSVAEALLRMPEPEVQLKLAS
jgi:hypothetical protein